MSELRPGGRELIESARRERTPSSEARARVLAGVLASTGAASVAASAKAALTPTTASFAKVGLAKASLIAALAAAGIAATYFGLRGPEAVPEKRAAANAVAAASVGLEAHVADPATPEASATPQPIDAPSGSGSIAEKRASAPPIVASAGGLERQLSLLQRAHAAYRAGQPGLALQLAREQASAFPHSQLAAEGLTIQVLSLCALGRTKEARAIADRLRAASGSPALSGLEGSCVSR